MTKTRETFLAALAELARELIPTIEDDYRATDDPSDDEPGMQVTIGADKNGWSYQTGDNSFTGGAYGYCHWGVGSLSRDTAPEAFAEAILSDLESQTDEEGEFFYELTD